MASSTVIFSRCDFGQLENCAFYLKQHAVAAPQLKYTGSHKSVYEDNAETLRPRRYQLLSTLLKNLHSSMNACFLRYTCAMSVNMFSESQ